MCSRTTPFVDRTSCPIGPDVLPAFQDATATSFFKMSQMYVDANGVMPGAAYGVQRQPCTVMWAEGVGRVVVQAGKKAERLCLNKGQGLHAANCCTLLQCAATIASCTVSHLQHSPASNSCPVVSSQHPLFMVGLRSLSNHNACCSSCALAAVCMRMLSTPLPWPCAFAVAPQPGLVQIGTPLGMPPPNPLCLCCPVPAPQTFSLGLELLTCPPAAAANRRSVRGAGPRGRCFWDRLFGTSFM